MGSGSTVGTDVGASLVVWALSVLLRRIPRSGGAGLSPRLLTFVVAIAGIKYPCRIGIQSKDNNSSKRKKFEIKGSELCQ